MILEKQLDHKKVDAVNGGTSAVSTELLIAGILLIVLFLKLLNVFYKYAPCVPASPHSCIWRECVVMWPG